MNLHCLTSVVTQERAADSAYVVYPLLRVGEGLAVGDVVADDRHGGVPDVRRDQRSEALLTSGVPQLQPHGAIVDGHRLGDEVDADGRGVVVVKLVVHESADDRSLAH